MTDISQETILTGDLAASGDLSDVVLSSPIEDDILVRNASNQWVNQPPGGETKVFRIGHSYLVSGSIAVPSGQTDFIVPFTVQFASGQTANLVTARYSINAGTSVTLDVTRNGSNITGYTGISVTTTPATTTQTQALTSDDELAIVISGVSGSPFNLSFTLFIEYSQ